MNTITYTDLIIGKGFLSSHFLKPTRNIEVKKYEKPNYKCCYHFYDKEKKEMVYCNKEGIGEINGNILCQECFEFVKDSVIEGILVNGKYEDKKLIKKAILNSPKRIKEEVKSEPIKIVKQQSQPIEPNKPEPVNPLLRKFDIYQLVTDKIIEQLEKGVIPWHKPWSEETWVRNIRGTFYRGINVLLLMMNDFTCPIYATFNQIKQKGGRIKKGEKGSQVVYYKLIPVEKVIEDKVETKFIPFLRYYTVFNLEQQEGIPIPEVKKTTIIQ